MMITRQLSGDARFLRKRPAMRKRIACEEGKCSAMGANELHYYTSGYTAKGYRSLVAGNLEGMEHVYILRNGCRAQNDVLLREVAQRQAQAGDVVEYLHHPMGEGGLDGVVFPELRVAVMQASALEDLPQTHAIDSGILPEQEKLHIAIQAGLQGAVKAFREALDIHDVWEAIYIERMDRAGHRAATVRLIAELLGEHRLQKTPAERHRFLGAATPQGARDFIPNLTEGLACRIFLKGRPGTGKSTLLKKLAAQALEQGFDTEVYHCGFDPDSLDMVILRELDVAVIDTTAPHEYFPDRPGDEIFDLYEKIITPGTDEEQAERLAQIAAAYRAKVAQSTAYLAKAQQAENALEAATCSREDPGEMEKTRRTLFAVLDGGGAPIGLGGYFQPALID